MYKTMLDASRGGKTADMQDRAHYERRRKKGDSADAAKGDHDHFSTVSKRMQELIAKAVKDAPERPTGGQ